MTMCPTSHRGDMQEARWVRGCPNLVDRLPLNVQICKLRHHKEHFVILICRIGNFSVSLSRSANVQTVSNIAFMLWNNKTKSILGHCKNEKKKVTRLYLELKKTNATTVKVFSHGSSMSRGTAVPAYTALIHTQISQQLLDGLT